MLTNKHLRSVLHLFSLKGFDIMKDKKKTSIKLCIFVGVVLIILSCTVPYKIFVTLYDIANDGSGSWSSSNGVIITAPAVTRDEAVKVSKKLVKGEHFEDELE